MAVEQRVRLRVVEPGELVALEEVEAAEGHQPGEGHRGHRATERAGPGEQAVHGRQL
ncbi:MAG: hypothetical protein KatS3mg010_1884 [Acidimicrobiia bacterium]|nr:MAG: hypothetical protein KatS3mg010_1884 [Acidimicrobiia bacterium]